MNQIVPIDRKFLCEYRNGSSFATNPTTDYVSYLQSNVFENVQVVAQYKVSTVTFGSTSVKIKFETDGSEIKVTHPFADWSDEGFAVGNTIKVRDASTNTNNSETVNNIVGNEMFISDTSFFTNMGWTDGDAQPYSILKVTTAPTSLIFQFGLIPTNTFVASSDPYASILDGQSQTYSANGITGSYSTLNYLSTDSSDLGQVECKYDGATGTDSEFFTFTVRHTFRVPHYIAAWLVNYENGTIPSNFTGTNSYKWQAKLNFGNNINNPNEGKVFVDDYLDGSVGFIGQNFNTGSSVYTLETDVEFVVSGDTVDDPQVGETNVVTAQIKKNDGNFTAGVQCILYHSKAATTIEYSDNENSFDDNFLFESLANTDGSGAASNVGGCLQNFTCNINGADASLVDISFRLVYPSSYASNLQNDDKIILVVSVEDSSLDAEDSDRTTVLLEVTTVDKSTDVEGQISNYQLSIKQVGAATGYTDAKTWINSAFEHTFSFDMAKAANSSDALLKSLKYACVALNTSTLDFFELESYNFPLGKIAAEEVDGTTYQVKTLDTTRFLSFPADHPIREVQLSMSAPGSYSATQTISGKIGYVIPWQEWIENLNVPTSFYNSALPDEFFNQNKRASNYSAVGGYDIYVFLIATVIAEGVDTDYALYSDKFTVYDFDEDGTGNGWSADIDIFDSSDDETDEIYVEDCTIVVTYSQASAGSLDLADLEGDIVFEEKNNTGRHWRLHTNQDLSETNNPLEPSTGETYVKMTQDVGNNEIILECVVDGTKTDLLKKYNIYSHLFDGT